jgi:hypothetical protein
VLDFFVTLLVRGKIEAAVAWTKREVDLSSGEKIDDVM